MRPRLYLRHDRCICIGFIPQDHRDELAGSLIFFPVLALLLIIQNAQVAFISRFADAMFFYGTQHGTARLVAMRAVVESAIGREFEYFREVMCDFRTFHFDRTKTFDTRSVNQVTTIQQRNHLRKGGSMHSLVMVFGDIAGTEIDTWDQFIDNS